MRGGCGTERFFRPAYAGHLLDEWIPAMTGVEEKLKMGAKVADIGCGLGTSSMLMAEQYPNSTIHAFDFHEPSIEEAKKRAKEKGEMITPIIITLIGAEKSIPNSGET